ncbi:YjbE family integral membrane protein [Rhodoblastus acidophilus]|uniref:TerC family protein n=1 Tax=Rhodoblastus acidophilus TaxID=1074 RepID=UPI0022244598|nr:TerC family protein [Rhodoblastus acidophilus]MCW2283744.1 YjbE family integral membrane protein [Rhodoblastus acidophilus]MCW2332907.1 YjbE family integral membrane protein [Rhodoblastus acidophilus]
MDYFSASYLVPLLEIIWIDILLSGDNAVVIAMACRSLPPNRQRLGIGLGAATAVVLRIVFAAIIIQLLAIPYLRIGGGALLLWIAVKLLQSEEEDENQVAAHATLFAAVRTIALADLVMSLDNVVAVAAAAHGQISLFVIGLLISIPFVVGGASLLSGLIQRFPALIWLGGALLGWISGEMIASDPLVIGLTQGASVAHGSVQGFVGPIFGAALVVAVGHLLSRRRLRAAKAGDFGAGSE